MFGAYNRPAAFEHTIYSNLDESVNGIDASSGIKWIPNHTVESRNKNNMSEGEGEGESKKKRFGTIEKDVSTWNLMNCDFPRNNR